MADSGVGQFATAIAVIASIVIQQVAAAHDRRIAAKTAKVIAKASDDALVKAEEIKTTMVKTAENHGKELHDIKILVDSKMSIALQANAILARKVADITGLKGDKDNADKAEKDAATHEANEAKLES